jgi:hypothetical protein
VITDFGLSALVLHMYEPTNDLTRCSRCPYTRAEHINRGQYTAAPAVATSSSGDERKSGDRTAGTPSLELAAGAAFNDRLTGA